MSNVLRLTLLSLVSCLLTSIPALAGLMSSTPTLTGDSTGTKTRTDIAVAIAEADQLIADLAPADAAGRRESWTRLYGTAAAADAIEAAGEVRDALTALRDNWDMLSVETLSLKTGWNAFYVYVSDPAPAAAVVNPSGYAARLRARVAADFADPAETAAAEMLGRLENLAAAYVGIRTRILTSFNSKTEPDWPAENVYAYTGSSEALAQFTTDAAAEASAANPYLTWSAAAPDAVNMPSFPAGFTYAAFSTASVSRTVALLGTRVASGSMNWHLAGGTNNVAEWNRFGVTTQSSRMNTDRILKDLDFACTGVAKMKGASPDKIEFSFAGPGASLSASDGEVLIANASGSSTWYPAPVAAPSDGVTVAAEESVATFQLRNATAAAQTVTGRLYRTGILGSKLDAVRWIEVEATAARGWQKWYYDQESPSNTVFADELAAGETRTYRVRIPRTIFDAACRGKEYADGFERAFSALMCFSYGSNGACSYLSLVGESSQGSVAVPYPAGLWVGTMTFDRVSQVKGNQTIVHGVAANGRMRVRAIVHVDLGGTPRLLHHVAIETTAVTNAAGDTVAQSALYAGSAKPSAATDGATTVQRLDSIAMDIDHPVVEGTGSITNGTLSFAWTVAPEGRANPFHHPFHPDHDGLTADYSAKAPSGDDMDNYRNGQIKPETWSIRNTLALDVTESDDSDTVSTCSGTCTWTLGNLRRSVNGEDVKASGTFSMRRVQNVGVLKQ